MELLSDERQSISDDLKRVTDMIPAIKTQIFKAKGNQFLDKATQIQLLEFSLELEHFKSIFTQKQTELE